MRCTTPCCALHLARDAQEGLVLASTGALEDLLPEHHVHEAGLVLERHEGHAAGRPGPLAADDQPGVAHPAPRRSAGSAPSAGGKRCMPPDAPAAARADAPAGCGRSPDNPRRWSTTHPADRARTRAVDRRAAREGGVCRATAAHPRVRPAGRSRSTPSAPASASCVSARSPRSVRLTRSSRRRRAPPRRAASGMRSRCRERAGLSRSAAPCEQPSPSADEAATGSRVQSQSLDFTQTGARRRRGAWRRRPRWRLSRSPWAGR
jgi:hypothetical protein